MVQWLRLCTPNTEVLSLVGESDLLCHAVWPKKKKKQLMKGAGEKKKKQLEKEQTKPKLSRRKDVKEQRGIT